MAELMACFTHKGHSSGSGPIVAEVENVLYLPFSFD